MTAVIWCCVFNLFLGRVMSGICIQRHIIGNVFYSTFTNVFTALHGMQTRSSDENSVCLSVRPSIRPSVHLSVWQTRALWQNGRKIGSARPDYSKSVKNKKKEKRADVKDGLENRI